MRIRLTSVFVGDQERALKFYTEVLGFVKKTDLPAGQPWPSSTTPAEI